MIQKTRIFITLAITVTLIFCVFLSGCHQHNYSKTVVQPTCTETGYTQYVCAACGDSYKEDYIDALGHNYFETKVSATCISKGYTLHKCARCSNSYRDNETSSYGNHVGVGKCTTCGEDFFELIKERCIQNDQYGVGMYWIYLDDVYEDGYRISPNICYDPGEVSDEKGIKWQISLKKEGESGDVTLIIKISKIDGYYDYTAFSMKSIVTFIHGTIQASSLSKLSSLPYTPNSNSYSENDALSHLACTLAQAMVICANQYFDESGLQITSANLGFN